MHKTISSDIWKPTVTPIGDQQLPVPGIIDSHRVFTKTSLSRSKQENQIHNINREILQATQGHNITPKPFGSSTSQTMSRHYSNDSQPQQRQIGQQSPHARAFSPKLVHKQYNSPMDLYSMDNIRDTLEAHSEVLAPGVKGINFLKPDTPVNTESEVYKLVMQEDQLAKARNQQLKQQQISPITGGPSTIATPLHLHHNKDPSNTALNISIMRAGSNNPPATSPKPPITSHVEAPTANKSYLPSLNSQQSILATPICFDCDQSISGPFVRLQNNRNLHVDCFKCTTCGTSLKNVGHFTINDKLYCDIHAKQVQSMLQQQQRNRYLVIQQQEQQHQTLCNSSSPKPQGGQQRQRVPPPVAPKPLLATPVTVNNHEMLVSRTNSPCFPGLSSQQQWSSTKQLTSSKTTSLNNIANPYGGVEPHPQPNKVPPPVAPKPYTAQQKTQEYNSTTISGCLSSRTNQLRPAATRGRGLLKEDLVAGDRTPMCTHCNVHIQGPYVLAGQSTWCKQCSQDYFKCSSCQISLLDIGFVEDAHDNKYYCEQCFRTFHAPLCSRCNIRIKGDCLNALNEQWHPSCFVCGLCKRPFGNSSFYLEDGIPYCERDWNKLFTTKCVSCTYPIEAGDRWIEALKQSYHSQCFRCASCQINLEGSSFYCKNGRPYCKLHAN